jgi:hypothetical protein
MPKNTPNNTDSHPQLLTRRDVAELFQVSVRTVDRLTAAGLLPAVLIGLGGKKQRFRRRYRLAVVQRMIDAISRTIDQQ